MRIQIQIRIHNPAPKVAGLVRNIISTILDSNGIKWIWPVFEKCSLFFRAPIRLPENVVVDVVIVTKREGVLTHR
jgi:hypothetical protein